MFKPNNKVYLNINSGALGDTVAALPVLTRLYKENAIEKIIIHPRFIDLFKLYFPQELIFDSTDSRTEIDDNGKEVIALNFEAKQKIPVLCLNYEKLFHITALNNSLVDIASICLTGGSLRLKDKNYPLVDKKNLPKYKIPSKKYIVLAYGYTCEIRKMQDIAYTKLKNYILARGYDVVLIGNSNHEITYSDGTPSKPKYNGIDTKGCINLIDKTSLTEALSIIYYSKGIIGLDNGLIHLAGLTNVPIIAGYTTVDPEFRMPYRHNKLGWKVYAVEPDSKCRYCQNMYMILFGYSFVICNNKEKPLECTKSLNTDKWLSQLKKII